MKEYLRGIPEIGSLSVDYVFIEEKHPILFTATNAANRLFIVLNCDTRNQKQKWIIAETEISQLEKMVKNEIPVLDLFIQEGTKYIAEWNCQFNTIKYEVKEEVAVDLIDLPSSDFYFDADKEELECFMEHYQL